jgi:glycosyltransferase involved in cell wall biosynthesis
LPKDDVPSVAVLGAVGPDKGARRLERLAQLARARSAAVRFVLVGYLDVERGPWQSDDAVLTVHGRYETADLPDLLAHYRVALVLYPSAGPETFSYTLTEAWAAGRPVLVPPIGALAERVRDSGAGWIMTDAQWRDEAQMLDRLCALLAASERESIAAASNRARVLPHATLSEMTQATFALYDGAMANAKSAAQPSKPPLAAARLRYALRYVPWVPPPVAARTDASSASILRRVARAAANRRNTLAGRVLFRLTPTAVVAALRARLK